MKIEETFFRKWCSGLRWGHILHMSTSLVDKGKHVQLQKDLQENITLNH